MILDILLYFRNEKCVKVVIINVTNIYTNGYVHYINTKKPLCFIWIYLCVLICCSYFLLGILKITPFIGRSEIIIRKKGDKKSTIRYTFHKKRNCSASGKEQDINEVEQGPALRAFTQLSRSQNWWQQWVGFWRDTEELRRFGDGTYAYK